MTRVERYLAENGYTSCPGMLEILEAYEAWLTQQDVHDCLNCALIPTKCGEIVGPCPAEGNIYQGWRPRTTAPLPKPVDDDSANAKLMAEVAVDCPRADAGPLLAFINKYNTVGFCCTNHEGELLHRAFDAMKKSLGMEKP
jgi:hypothetical protein